MLKKKEIKRKTLTGLEKKKLCEEFRSNPNTLQKELALSYGISANSESNILKEADRWLNLDSTSSEAKFKRFKVSTNQGLKQVLLVLMVRSCLLFLFTNIRLQQHYEDWISQLFQFIIIGMQKDG